MIVLDSGTFGSQRRQALMKQEDGSYTNEKEANETMQLNKYILSIRELFIMYSCIFYYSLSLSLLLLSLFFLSLILKMYEPQQWYPNKASTIKTQI